MKKLTEKDLRLYEKGFEDGYATAKRLYKPTTHPRRLPVKVKKK